MPIGDELSNREARWLAIEAQGLSAPRAPRRIDRRHLRGLVDRIGTLQVDAVNVLERTQFVVPFSRLGPYDHGRLLAMSGPGGELFEYWGHAASLLPVETHPLFRWRMDAYGSDIGAGSGSYLAARRAWREEHDPYIEAVLDEVRQRGPLPASALSDPRRRDGEWWGRRSVGRQALEWLFATGAVTGWRTANFERVYDLPERVLPAEVLARPTPPVDEAHRQLLLLAARSLGVSTTGDLADYYRINRPAAQRRVDELVEAGELLPVTVEGWQRPAYCLPGVRPRRPRRQHATVLSPFDSLIWERDRTERLFGMAYRIEIYVPEPKRRFGYYVLPVLLGDELVARLDLKADRKVSTLRVQGAFLEPGADEGATTTAIAAELDQLRTWLGLDRLDVGDRGDLAPALRAAVGRAADVPQP